MEVVWFVVFWFVVWWLVSSGEKWNKGVDKHEVGMLWYRQKSR